MPTKPTPRQDAKGIIGFRLDPESRQRLEDLATISKQSVHEEARQRLIDTLSDEAEDHSGQSAASQDLDYLRDRVCLLDEKVNAIANDVAMLTFLFLVQRQPMTPDEAKAYIQKNIASYSFSKKSNPEDSL